MVFLRIRIFYDSREMINWEMEHLYGLAAIGLIAVVLTLLLACYTCRGRRDTSGTATPIRYRVATPGRPRRSWQRVPVQPPNPPPTPELVKNECCCMKVIDEEDGDTISI